MNLNQNHTLAIKQIVREVFSDLTDMGAITDYINPSAHTMDFELPDGLKMRAKEEKNIVYYHVFREK